MVVVLLCGSAAFVSFHGIAQSGSQGLQQIAPGDMATLGRLVDGLPDLIVAERQGRPLVLPEPEAGGVPIELAERQHPTGGAFQISDEILVVDLQQLVPAGRPPVIHQLFIESIQLSGAGQGVRPSVGARWELLRPAGEAHVHGVTLAMDDPCSWEQIRDPAGEQIVAELLVDDAGGVTSMDTDVLHVFVGDRGEGGGLGRGYAGRPRGIDSISLSHRGDQFGQPLRFAHAVGAAMGVDDLFGEGRTASRHADDEDVPAAIDAR